MYLLEVLWRLKIILFDFVESFMKFGCGQNDFRFLLISTFKRSQLSDFQTFGADLTKPNKLQVQKYHILKIELYGQDTCAGT
jgi:hypothetical protein